MQNKYCIFIILTGFMIIFLLLSSCQNIRDEEITTPDDNFITDNNETGNDSTPSGNDEVQPKFLRKLTRTGEFYTAEQMELLKSEALSWQYAKAGIGGFADIVAIEPADGENQQVFISIDYKSTYEKIQIETSIGEKARIISASSGAGSCEIELGYKFVTENSEWVELFYFYADISNENEQWKNITEYSAELVEILNELKTEDKQFK